MKDRLKKPCGKGRKTNYGVMTHNVFCPTGEGGGIDPTCSLHTSEATPRFGEEVSKALKTIDPKFIEDAKARIKVIREPSQELKAKGVTHSTRAFADGPEIVLIESNMRSLSTKDIAHTIAHEVAHKWEKLREISSSNDEHMWAMLGDRSKLTGEQKQRWGYVAKHDPEVITEAIAQIIHPHEKTAWGIPTSEFVTTFPKTIAYAHQLLQQYDYNTVNINSSPLENNGNTSNGVRVWKSSILQRDYPSRGSNSSRGAVNGKLQHMDLSRSGSSANSKQMCNLQRMDSDSTNIEFMELTSYKSGVNKLFDGLKEIASTSINKPFRPLKGKRKKIVQEGTKTDHLPEAKEPIVNVENPINQFSDWRLTGNVSIKALSGTVYDLMDDITKAEANEIARTIIEGVNNDKSPNAVAKALKDRLGFDDERAKTVAITEMTRVQAADSLKEAAKLKTNTVRFVNSNDPCPQCIVLNGKEYALKDAQHVIPVHVGCTCKWINTVTVNVDDGSDYDIFITNEDYTTENVFCPKGKDGGIDPHCGKHKSQLHPLSGQLAKQLKVSEEKASSILKKAAQQLSDHIKKTGVKSARIRIGNTNIKLHAKAKENTDGKEKEKQDVTKAEKGGTGSKPVPKPTQDATKPVEGKNKQPSISKPTVTGDSVDRPVSAKPIKRSPRELADINEVNKKIDRVRNVLAKKGQHEVVGWLDKLKEHVNQNGVKSSFDSLGAEKSRGKHDTNYEGGWDKAAFDKHTGDWHLASFCEVYLNRNGISMQHQLPDEFISKKPLVSSLTPTQGGTDSLSKTTASDFLPKDPKLFNNKLIESQHLPGLENSEDLSKLLGKKVHSLTPEVHKELDAKYGKDKWIVKAYGDEAAAGYGIFFPQRSRQIVADAQKAIWESGSEMSKYGFSHHRNNNGTIVGIRHKDGEVYKFGTKKYNDTINGDVRKWADVAQKSAPNEKAAALPKGGKEFMVQPAFNVVGISEQDRANGVTHTQATEARVHLITRNGKVEVVPHATWLKGANLPVVFEDDHTRALAKAAKEIIEKLPASERQGQIYSPDIVKTDKGYKAVEVNPANHTGSSGYLGNSPLTIDSYVSHFAGKDPAHVQFIRSLLTKRKQDAKIRSKQTTTEE